MRPPAGSTSEGLVVPPASSHLHVGDGQVLAFGRPLAAVRVPERAVQLRQARLLLGLAKRLVEQLSRPGLVARRRPERASRLRTPPNSIRSDLTASASSGVTGTVRSRFRLSNCALKRTVGASKSQCGPSETLSEPNLQPVASAITSASLAAFRRLLRSPNHGARSHHGRACGRQWLGSHSDIFGTPPGSKSMTLFRSVRPAVVSAS